MTDPAKGNAVLAGLVRALAGGVVESHLDRLDAVGALRAAAQLAADVGQTDAAAQLRARADALRAHLDR